MRMITFAASAAQNEAKVLLTQKIILCKPYMDRRRKFINSYVKAAA
jgi:hypothetical protein